MKLKNIVYIIIEIARRELDSKIILALKAKENNFDVAITKKSRIFSVLKYLKSGIVFLKSFGPRYNPILDDIKKYGFKQKRHDNSDSPAGGTLYLGRSGHVQGDVSQIYERCRLRT